MLGGNQQSCREVNREQLLLNFIKTKELIEKKGGKDTTPLYVGETEMEQTNSVKFL